jgi:NIPSNAP
MCICHKVAIAQYHVRGYRRESVMTASATTAFAAAALDALLLTVAPCIAGQSPVLPILELRQYTLQPGTREAFITLFEREFVESQEVLGMRLVGQFRDLDKSDRFVWLRGFANMTSRPDQLTAFYTGPVWREHRQAANSMMVDSTNVLLLQVARPTSGFALGGTRPRAPSSTRVGLVVANIYYFDHPVTPAFIDFFDGEVTPQLKAAGITVLASFVTEQMANNFPRLPVREGEQVFVWFSSFADEAAHERAQRALSSSAAWPPIATALRGRMTREPEVLRLEPTPRSQLRG